ncbi:MAG: response regulator [Spirochaetia bacterium]|jgi:PAS domain S-box-containing protein|nr:response regulator [Spirochaetia bacterium]
MNYSIRIVVINDDPVQGRLFLLLLEKKGYNAVFYENAESFLEAEDGNSIPDLIITDLYMPGIDGWRLCRLLRTEEYSAYNKTPVLVISSTFAGEDASAITADMGANAFLSSPFENNLFYSIIEQLLKGETPVSRLKILAVEDSSVYRNLITRAFESESGIVTAAETGKDAEELFEKTLYDVIIIDYHLPDCKGSELLQIFRLKRPDSIIIMITSDPDPALALSWMKSGAAAYARKPFEPGYIVELCRRARREQLLLRVESHLDRKTKQLNKAQEDYRDFFNNLPVCAYKAEINGKIVTVNNACLEILRLGESCKEDLEEHSIFDFYADPEAVKTFKDHLIKKGFVNNLEAAITRCDCTKAWISHTARLVNNSEGKLFFISGTVQDITERKSAEESRLNSEIRLFNLINNSSDVLILLDKNGRIKFVSNSIERITGFKPEELTGNFYTDFIHPEYLPESVKAFNTLLVSKNPDEVFKIEYSAPHKSSGWVTIEAIGRNFINDPATNGIVVSVRDISERKENEIRQLMLEDNLRHAQKMESIGTMAGGIAHDFNNLLQAISGYTQLLMLDKNPDDPDYLKLDAINRAGESAALLVRQMLLFSRKAESVKITSNINVSVKHSLKIIERTIPKMIKIETSLDENVNPVKADPLQIEQIILNLCSNASDAMPDGGVLRIETGSTIITKEFFSENGQVPRGRYTFLDISDTGCGIDSSIISKIYDPFFTTKGTGKGTGLGLSTVYGIIKSHGGFLTCESSPESGTVFRLYFPASEDEISKNTDHPGIDDKKTAAGGEILMIVDDNKAILDFMDISLTYYGYKVIQAESGEEALEIFNSLKREIDLVILDINMPGMGGQKCLESLIKTSPGLKIIIASGYSSNLPEKELLDKGASAFISKPYTLKNLLSVTRKVLDNIS